MSILSKDPFILANIYIMGMVLSETEIETNVACAWVLILERDPLEGCLHTSGVPCFQLTKF